MAGYIQNMCRFVQLGPSLAYIEANMTTLFLNGQWHQTVMLHEYLVLISSRYSCIKVMTYFLWLNTAGPEMGFMKESVNSRSGTLAP